MYIILLQSLCFIFLLIACYLIIREQRRKLIHRMSVIQEIQEELNREKEHNAEAAKIIMNGVGVKVETLSQLSNAYFQMEDDSILNVEKKKGWISKEEILYQFRKTLQEFRDDDDTLALLEASLNATQNGIMKTVRNHYPNLRERDFTLLTLFFSGFSAKSISFNLGMSEAAVRMRKTRFKQLFLSSDSPEIREIADKLSR